MTMRRAIIIGGSLGGLFAASQLSRIGWSVDVFERSSSELESRGGGIVQQPEISTIFRVAGLDPNGPPGVVSKFRVYVSGEGKIVSKAYSPQKQTSWGAMWSALRSTVPDANYHLGKRVTGVTDEGHQVTATFADGTSMSADMLIGADGGGSTVRDLTFPSAGPDYAGYVAFRGLVAEAMFASAPEALYETFAFYQEPGSHILSYMVADEQGNVSEGKRRYNWVWYRNANESRALPQILRDRDGRQGSMGVAPGRLAPAVELELRSCAAAVLPSPFRELVATTAEPFVQAIVDLAVPRMVRGRVILLGDSASIPRPHTAASTAKAAGNALALATELVRVDHDVKNALARWEPEQLLRGHELRGMGQSLGDRSQFPNGRTYRSRADVKL